MVQELLDEAGALSLSDLDAIAYGDGPGSFTGLRVCAGVVQGLAFALELPVVAISTLAALAHGVRRRQPAELKADGWIVPAIDARIGQLYWCAYRKQDDPFQPQLAERLTRPEQLRLTGPGACIGVGDGWRMVADFGGLPEGGLLSVDADQLPQAENIASLGLVAVEAGQTLRPDQVQPRYLREELGFRRHRRPRVS